MTLKIVDWCLWRTLMPKLPMDQYKKPRGRPTKYDLPDYIPDTPQNVGGYPPNPAETRQGMGLPEGSRSQSWGLNDPSP